MARRGDGRGAYRVLVGKLKERDDSEDLSLDGRMLLKMDLQGVGWEGMD